MSKIYTAIILAIGLIITSCTKLTDREYLFPSPELTVVVPDSITSGIITFTISAKNATNLAYIIVRGVGNIDYYSLLQGEYSDAYMTSINPDGFEHTFNIKDVFPNESYSLYVAVSNNHNQIATFKKGYNYETIPPYITYISDIKEHTATNNGTRTTITFNEDIVRNDDMGAITYDVLDENLDYIATGTATATASGCQLTVSLPSSTVFEQLVFVLLSFEEGAVEDLCGNKMTAIENGLDYDLLPNGPWYMYDPTIADDENPLNQLLCVYNATAPSAFDGFPDENWEITIVADDETEGKIWIQPIISIGGFDLGDIVPVYATVDLVQETIQMPYGQTVYGGEGSSYNMVIAGLDNNPILSGVAVATYDLSDGAVITFQNGYGVGNLAANEWWYNAYQGAVFTKQ